MRKPSSPAAVAKVLLALEYLERAQIELGRACEALSPVVGMVKDWERLGKLYDLTNREWHRLNSRRDFAKHLDSEQP